MAWLDHADWKFQWIAAVDQRKQNRLCKTIHFFLASNQIQNPDKKRTSKCLPWWTKKMTSTRCTSFWREEKEEKRREIRLFVETNDFESQIRFVKEAAGGLNGSAGGWIAFQLCKRRKNGSRRGNVCLLLIICCVLGERCLLYRLEQGPEA